MNDILQEIDKIFLDSNNLVNNKIIGINYLEKLKYSLIDSFKKTKLFSYTEIQKLDTNKFTKKFGENNLDITINVASESNNYIKHKLQNDYLCIVLSGMIAIKIDLNEDMKDAPTLKIYPNAGIVLTKDTVINSIIASDCIFLEVQNIKLLNSIEN